MTHKIVVTQLDWNGRGDDRSFTYWPEATDLDGKIFRIVRAYNFAGGRTRMELDGRDVTDRVA